MAEPGLELEDIELEWRRRRRRAMLEGLDLVVRQTSQSPARRGSGGSSRMASPSAPADEELLRWRGAGGGGGGGGGGKASKPAAPPAGGGVVHTPVQREPVQAKQGLARGNQAAVVKLASFASGRARMGALVSYQSRGGDLALEREDGSLVTGKEALNALVASWASEVQGPEPSKDSLSFTVTLPGQASADEVAAGLGTVLEGHRYAWRSEARGGSTLVHIVTSAASSRRDEAGKPVRIFDNRKSLTRLEDRVEDTFGLQADTGKANWAHGRAGLTAHLREACKDGALTSSTGQIIASPTQAAELADSWKRDLRSREPRHTAHVILSARAGTPREAFVDAARATLAKEFAGHKYAFALHEDRAHLHLHAIVRMDHADGRQMHPRIGDFARWRSSLAEQARERGIAMEATSRFEQAHTPSYKLADIRAVEAGRAGDAQRRRVEGRRNRAVHVPTREEGKRRAGRDRAQWQALKQAAGLPEPAPGSVRLWRAVRPGHVSTAPIFAREAIVAMAQGGAQASLVYVDVPAERVAHIKPAKSDPARLVVVSRELAETSKPAAEYGQILAFAHRADKAARAAPIKRQTADQSPANDGKNAVSGLENMLESLANPGAGGTKMRSAAAMQSALNDIKETVAALRPLVSQDEQKRFAELETKLMSNGLQAIAVQQELERNRPGKGQERAPQEPTQKALTKTEQATADGPGRTPAERDLALQQIAQATRNEARKEVREASDSRRLGIDNVAEGSAVHPHRSAQEARTAQQAARSVNQDPTRPMQTEAGQSQAVQQLSAEQQRILDNQRREEVAQRIAQERQAEQAKNKNQDRER